jgi:hypothetical protein
LVVSAGRFSVNFHSLIFRANRTIIFLLAIGEWYAVREHFLAARVEFGFALLVG